LHGGAPALDGWVPVDLRDASRASLLLDARGSDSVILVTRDGVTWQRVALIPASADWTGVAVDLSQFVGDVVYLRFAGDLHETKDVRIVRSG
jgi:hypothetical protein